MSDPSRQGRYVHEVRAGAGSAAASHPEGAAMRSKLVRRPLLIAVLAGVALAAVACSSTSEQVSDQISSQVKDKLSLATEPTVTCPDDAKASKGATFTCTIELEKATIPVKVTFKDDKNFTSTVQGAVFKKPTLDAALKKKLVAAKVAVKSIDCDGTKLVVIGLKSTVACTATDASGGSATFGVVLDKDGKPQLKGAIFQNDSLEAAITTQLANNNVQVTSVKCGDPSIKVVTKTTSYTCAVVDTTGATGKVTISLDTSGSASITDLKAD